VFCRPSSSSSLFAFPPFCPPSCDVLIFPFLCRVFSSLSNHFFPLCTPEIISLPSADDGDYVPLYLCEILAGGLTACLFPFLKIFPGVGGFPRYLNEDRAPCPPLPWASPEADIRLPPDHFSSFVGLIYFADVPLFLFFSPISSLVPFPGGDRKIREAFFPTLSYFFA